MGYADSGSKIQSVSISGDSLINSESVQTTMSAVYTKLKSISRSYDIHPIGSLRISFEGWNISNNSWFKIYRNGMPIGTERLTALHVPQTWSEDFTFTDLRVGDTFELYAHGDTGINVTKVANFKICGIQSNFVKSN